MGPDPDIMGGQVRARGELHVETQGLSHSQGILPAVLIQHPRPRSGRVPSPWKQTRGEPGEEQQASGGEHRDLWPVNGRDSISLCGEH